MLIYKDFLSGDELLSDAYDKRMKLVNDVYYDVDAKQVTRTDNIDDSMFGGNASAEGGGDEGADGAVSQSGIDIVMAHQLQQQTFSKKTYRAYMKKYCKLLLEKLTVENKERADKFKAGMPAVVKMILENFDDWEMYVGENWDEEGNPGMVVCLNWRQNDKQVDVPYMVYFKDGLREEKV